jgi:tRNA 2-(methylsulfanyl)-N6-isopentenyladenosine37 hydroxylase
MLGLKLATDPRWVNLAEKSIHDILTDHAYCEQKAATSCISLIVYYNDKEELVKTLSPIVTEEWAHFRMVLQELEERGLKLGRQRKDDYANAMLSLERTGRSPEVRLIDRLLINALIEARSCERFRLLSEGLEDEGLKQFYHDLMKSEAGHYMTFVELAKTYFPAEEVKTRLEEMLEAETKIMEELTLRGDRMH